MEVAKTDTTDRERANEQVHAKLTKFVEKQPAEMKEVTKELIQSIGHIFKLPSSPLEVSYDPESPSWTFVYKNQPPLIINSTKETLKANFTSLLTNFKTIIDLRDRVFDESSYFKLINRVRSINLILAKHNAKEMGKVATERIAKSEPPMFTLKIGPVSLSKADSPDSAADSVLLLSNEELLIRYRELLTSFQKKKELTKAQKDSIHLRAKQDLQGTKPKEETPVKKATPPSKGAPKQPNGKTESVKLSDSDYLKHALSLGFTKFQITHPLHERDDIKREKRMSELEEKEPTAKDSEWMFANMPMQQMLVDDKDTFETVSTSDHAIANTKRKDVQKQQPKKGQNPQPKQQPKQQQQPQRKDVNVDETVRMTSAYKNKTVPSAEDYKLAIEQVHYNHRDTPSGELVSHYITMLDEDKGYVYPNAGDCCTSSVKHKANDGHCCRIFLGRTAKMFNGEWQFTLKLCCESVSTFDLFMRDNMVYKKLVKPATEEIIRKLDLKMILPQGAPNAHEHTGRHYINRRGVILDYTVYDNATTFELKTPEKKLQIETVHPKTRNKIFRDMRKIAKVDDKSRIEFVETANGWILRLGGLQSRVVASNVKVFHGYNYQDLSNDILIKLYADDETFKKQIDKILSTTFANREDAPLTWHFNKRDAEFFKNDVNVKKVVGELARVGKKSAKWFIISNNSKDKPPMGVVSIANVDKYTEPLTPGKNKHELYREFADIIVGKIGGWIANYNANNPGYAKKIPVNPKIALRGKIRRLYESHYTLSQIRDMLKMNHGTPGKLPGTTMTTIDIPVFNSLQQSEMISRGIDPGADLSAALTPVEVMQKRMIRMARVPTIFTWSDQFVVSWGVRVIRKEGDKFRVALYIKSRDYLSPSPDGTTVGRLIRAGTPKTAAQHFIFSFYPYDVHGMLTTEAESIQRIFAEILTFNQESEAARQTNFRKGKNTSRQEARDYKDQRIEDFDQRDFSHERYEEMEEREFDNYDSEEDYQDSDDRYHQASEDSTYHDGRELLAKGKNRRGRRRSNSS